MKYYFWFIIYIIHYLIKIRSNHNIRVIILTSKPILVQIQAFFCNMTISPNTNDIGGAKSIRNPPRIPSSEPQPKPGHPNI